MIYLVCGFGRCGSSLAMQMLAAGGFPVSGGWPGYEVSNPDFTKLHGTAVKVLDAQRPGFLPPAGTEVRSLWLSRDTLQQALSQVKFGTLTMGLPSNRKLVRQYERSYRRDLPLALQQLRRFSAPHYLTFETMLALPYDAVRILAGFVERPLDTTRAVAVVRDRPPRSYPGLLEEKILNDGAPSWATAL